MRPVPELEILRCHARSWKDTTLTAGGLHWLKGAAGTSCELQMEIAPGNASRAGLKVLASGDTMEETLLYYDFAAKQLVCDATRSGPTGLLVVERAPLELRPGEPLKLQVFIDKSIVEIFANDRQAIGRRVYPSRVTSVGVGLFSDGGATSFSKLTAWEIVPSNPF